MAVEGLEQFLYTRESHFQKPGRELHWADFPAGRAGSFARRSSQRTPVPEMSPEGVRERSSTQHCPFRLTSLYVNSAARGEGASRKVSEG